jgi:hypothetical protein
LFSGSIYGLLWSFYLAFSNRKPFLSKFKVEFYKNKKLFYFVLVFGLVIGVLSFILNQILFLFFGILILLFSPLYAFAKAVEEACLVKKTKTKELTEGDWLYKDLVIGKTKINANWEGLTKKEIDLLKKKTKFVLIRQGIPFVPVFLISFIVFVYVIIYLW